MTGGQLTATFLESQPRRSPSAVPLLPLSSGIEMQAEAERLFEGADREILHVAHASLYLLLPTVATWLGDLAARGVLVRTLAPPPNSGYAESVHPGMPSRNALRFADWLPPVLLIADRQAAIIVGGSSCSDALLVVDPALTAVMATVFDQCWLNAATHAQPAAISSVGTWPTETDLALLRLLAAGHTDETVARRLGVSLRTVRRRIAAMMIELDAGSRFEAGINAARRGWL